MSNITSTPPISKHEFLRLVHNGLLETEYSPWPDQIMSQAIANMIESNYTADPNHKSFLNATDLVRLQNLIPTFTQDDISARTTLVYCIITAATVTTVALRFYSRRCITGK